jgi:hypothetical protein
MMADVQDRPGLSTQVSHEYTPRDWLQLADTGTLVGIRFTAMNEDWQLHESIYLIAVGLTA